MFYRHTNYQPENMGACSVVRFTFRGIFVVGSSVILAQSVDECPRCYVSEPNPPCFCFNGKISLIKLCQSPDAGREKRWCIVLEQKWKCPAGRVAWRNCQRVTSGRKRPGERRECHEVTDPLECDDGVPRCKARDEVVAGFPGDRLRKLPACRPDLCRVADQVIEVGTVVRIARKVFPLVHFASGITKYEVERSIEPGGFHAKPVPVRP